MLFTSDVKTKHFFTYEKVNERRERAGAQTPKADVRMRAR